MKSKKALAIVLAIAMLFGVVSMASAASSLAPSGFADSQDSKQANAIAYLKAFGVLRGDAGTNNVRPNDPLTREEFVVMVARATGTESIANGLAGIKPNFTDAAQISDWAVGAVNLATGQGWIKGYEDGTFRPKGNLTVAEAITVLVRATGHEQTVSSVALWPVGHIMKAREVGISAGVTVNANAPITREDMARLTYNSLFIPTATKDADGKVVNGDPLVSAQATAYVGRVSAAVDVANQRITLEYGDPAANHTHDLADEVVLLGGNTLAALNGLRVRATANVDGEIYIIEVLEGGAGTGYFKELTKTNNVADGMKLDDGTTFKMTQADTAVEINGKPISYGGAPTDDFADIAALFNSMTTRDQVVATVNADGLATKVEINRLNSVNYVVVSVTAPANNNDPYTVRVHPHNNAAGEIDLNVPQGTQVVLNGEAASVGDLKAYDVVDLAIRGFTAAANNDVVLRIDATRNVVSGTVDGVVAKFVSAGTYRATVTVKLADGTKQSVDWVDTGNNATAAINAAGGGAAPAGAVSYLLNSAGRAVFNNATAPQNAFGKVISVYESGGDNYVEVDINGVTTTFAYDPTDFDFTTVLNQLGRVTYNAAEGAKAWNGAGAWGDEGTIQTILEGNIIIYKVGNTTHVVANPIVYKANADFDGAAGYLGVEDLAVGDSIKVSANHGFVIKK